MNLNAAALRLMAAKGLTLEDVAEIAWAMEGGHRQPRIPVTPANDRARRTSAQRRKTYSFICERDGEKCAECSCGPQTIWRRQGINSSEDGDQFTIVWPTPNLEVDHIQPLWAGGTNALANLWLLCQGCHKKKTAIEAGQRRRA